MLHQLYLFISVMFVTSVTSVTSAAGVAFTHPATLPHTHMNPLCDHRLTACSCSLTLNAPLPCDQRLYPMTIPCIHLARPALPRRHTGRSSCFCTGLRRNGAPPRSGESRHTLRICAIKARPLRRQDALAVRWLAPAERGGRLRRRLCDRRHVRPTHTACTFSMLQTLYPPTRLPFAWC